MKKAALFLVVLTTVFSSCNISYDLVSNYNQQQTNVVLSKPNFKVIGQVEGVSSQTYVFGIGGLSEKSLSSTALNEMYRSADMIAQGKSIAVINVSVGVKRSGFLIAWRKKAIARGTLIEFISGNETDTALSAENSPAADTILCSEKAENTTDNINENIAAEASKGNVTEPVHAKKDNEKNKHNNKKRDWIELKKVKFVNGDVIIGRVKKLSIYNRVSGKGEISYRITQPNGVENEYRDYEIKSIKNIKVSSEEYSRLKIAH